MRKVLYKLYTIALASNWLKRWYRISKRIEVPYGLAEKALAPMLIQLFGLARRFPQLRAMAVSIKSLTPSGVDSRLTRKDKVFFAIDKKGLGLEIGPSFNPLAPKREGFNVHVLDHASAEELREKYSRHPSVKPQAIQAIEQVDFVWKGEPYSELIGKSEYYDWIIASHLIEHTPDMIGFFKECEKLMKPDGVLSLVIPDKRFCFDYFIPETTTGQLLDAHNENRKVATPGQIFDHCAYVSKVENNLAWSPGQGPPDQMIYDFSLAEQNYFKALRSSEYQDIHVWRFTPMSFLNTIQDLQSLKLLSLMPLKVFETTGFEFFVTLKKAPNVQSEGDITSKNERLKRALAVAEERVKT